MVPTYVDLMLGDPAPNPGNGFDIAAGRYVVVCFYVTSSDVIGRSVVQKVFSNREYFDDIRFTFYGFCLDSRGEEGRSRERGIRFLLDSDWTISRLFGSIPKDSQKGSSTPAARRFWLVLDPTLRIQRIIPFALDGSDTAALFEYLAQLPPPERFAGIELRAPILFLPNVFETEFCRQLIDLYEANGGEETGVWDIVDGKPLQIMDHGRKRRKDYVIKDNPELVQQIQFRLSRRVFPEIWKAHAFKATGIDRYLISCYAAEDHGHFRPHRDNTTPATAHRRFAVSINLNSEFAGGEIGFPEYGSYAYKPSPGSALVFSCGLLHAVSPVTCGRRFAFLPFVLDDEASRLARAYNS